MTMIITTIIIILEWCLPVPAQHWGDGPDNGEEPDSEDSQKSTVDGHRLTGETLDDNIVSVEGDHCHCPNGATSEQGAQHGVDLAHERSKHPCLVVAVYYLFREFNRIRKPVLFHWELKYVKLSYSGFILFRGFDV